MNLRTRDRHRDQLQHLEPAGATEDFGSLPDDQRNVLVSHGIHNGRFPIGGMSVRDARHLLTPLIQIDAEAVPVINGHPVEEDTMITEEINMLAFVKPASMRG